MQHINTDVVVALMNLQGIDVHTLSKLVLVPKATLETWLADRVDGSDELVPFETQLEVLRVLGFAGDSLRSDKLHFWHIHENFFSRAERTYHALDVMFKTFGDAEAAYLARESDPAMKLEASAYFALRFNGFNVVLKVTANPLRGISFDPERISSVHWIPEALGILLPADQYDSMEPGALKVPALQQYITFSSEAAEWERLRDFALEKGISVASVTSALRVVVQGPGLAAPESAARVATEQPAAAAPAQLEAVPPSEPEKAISEFVPPPAPVTRPVHSGSESKILKAVPSAATPEALRSMARPRPSVVRG